MKERKLDFSRGISLCPFWSVMLKRHSKRTSIILVFVRGNFSWSSHPPPSPHLSLTGPGIEVGVGVTYLMKRIWEKNYVSAPPTLLSQTCLTAQSDHLGKLRGASFIWKGAYNWPAGLECLGVTLGKCY